jgi:hypothetical protein
MQISCFDVNDPDLNLSASTGTIFSHAIGYWLVFSLPGLSYALFTMFPNHHQCGAETERVVAFDVRRHEHGMLLPGESLELDG